MGKMGGVTAAPASVGRRPTKRRIRDDGIQAAWRVGVEGPGSEPRDGYVRRAWGTLPVVGGERRRGGHEAGRHLPRCRAHPVRLGGRVFRRHGRGDPRQGDRGASRPRHPLDQGDLPRRDGAERRRLVATPPDPRRRVEPAAARHRLHRPLPTPRVRRIDARGGGRRDARRAGQGRQDPVCRLLELLGMAPDEVAGGVGAVRAGAVRRAPGVLLARSAAITSGN